MNEKMLCCNDCQHLYIFEAKKEDRYVCCLYGKRITVEPEYCKGYKRKVKK